MERVDVSPIGMPGKPFQSKLEPYFDLIREERLKRQTWEAIVQLLAAKGITTTGPAVYKFLKRRLKRRYPFGMAPAPPSVTISNQPETKESVSETSKLTEPPPPTSEFDSDPLTKPLKVKNPKPKWAVFKPQS